MTPEVRRQVGIDLRLVAETRVDGVVLAQLFAVIRSQTVTLPGDPTGTQWYVPASLPEILARSAP